ncbi:MAG: hypothetical protein O3C28_18380 [Proteobacteria bacterium]|nr:hypothetical protein [Pseudomonadota bacterium]
MILRLLVIATCVFFMLDAQAENKLQFVPPDFLNKPVVANSMLGRTYAYRAGDLQASTSLQITVVTLPKAALSAGEFSTEHCIQLFLTEIARNQPGFFAVPAERELEAGDLRLPQIRWSYRSENGSLTGVTSCGFDQDRYISINFQDTLKSASTTFPGIRKSLQSLRVEQ